jgi:hypothetical protein
LLSSGKSSKRRSGSSHDRKSPSPKGRRHPRRWGKAKTAALDIASIVDKLRVKAAKTPPGTWVEGYFFDDTKVKDNRQLNVHDLDQRLDREGSSRRHPGQLPC